MLRAALRSGERYNPGTSGLKHKRHIWNKALAMVAKVLALEMTLIIAQNNSTKERVLSMEALMGALGSNPDHLRQNVLKLFSNF